MRRFDSRNPSFLGNGFTTFSQKVVTSPVDCRNPSFLGNGFTTKRTNWIGLLPYACRNPSFLGNGFTTLNIS